MGAYRKSRQYPLLDLEPTPWYIEHSSAMITQKMVVMSLCAKARLVSIRRAGKRHGHDSAIFSEGFQDSVNRRETQQRNALRSLTVDFSWTKRSASFLNDIPNDSLLSGVSIYYSHRHCPLYG